MPREALGRCLLCRGAKALCGSKLCPFLSYWRAFRDIRLPKAEVLEAPSPPSIFVGRTGYPRVRVAPAVVAEDGQADLYDYPERWLNLSLDEILRMRISLVRGCLKVDVDKPYMLEEAKLIAASSKPVDLEFRFSKPPKLSLSLDLHAPPLGPVGYVEKLRLLDNPKIPKPVEKVIEEPEVKAVDAVWSLYSNNVPVSQIQRLFSVGAFGSPNNRRIVPTRWSITAVDDIISKRLLKMVKRLPIFDCYLFFERKFMKNTFIAIIAPEAWSYEWIEAWFPYTTWNPDSEVEVEGDWEDYFGRTSYASLGGCYYAARLATAEFMLRERRQGTAILIREIYEGFFLPIGVWFVRENLREMFRSKPEKYDSLKEVLERLSKATRLPLSTWLSTSTLLRILRSQSRLEVPAL
ncbi:MAG: hypothetical protein J7K78_01325 [Thaumarchaeota archaeon]|nr:hypothetical protein [Nitrososphaerota archaeon]